MRAVPGKNTSVERALRVALRTVGLRGYRLHNTDVPGTPDVVFGPERVAVFVDGCFWHGCPKCYREPKSRKEYWQMKVQRNRDRDANVNAACVEKGWRVVRLWEHEVTKQPERAAATVRKALKRPTPTRRPARAGKRRRRKVRMAV
jgi:DNA mismatch endonuclease (patch repair protein)